MECVHSRRQHKCQERTQYLACGRNLLSTNVWHLHKKGLGGGGLENDKIN